MSALVIRAPIYQTCPTQLPRAHITLDKHKWAKTEPDKRVGESRSVKGEGEGREGENVTGHRKNVTTKYLHVTESKDLKICKKAWTHKWKLLFANRDTVIHTFHTVSSSLFSLLVPSSKRPVGGFQLSRSSSRIGNGVMWAANGSLLWAAICRAESSVSSNISSWVFCDQQYVELGLLWAAICRVGSSVSSNMSSWVFCEQQYVELGLLWAAICRVESSVSSNMSSWVFCEQQYVELGLLWATICRAESSVNSNMSSWVFCEQHYVELGLLWAALCRVGSSVSSNMSSWVFCEQQYVELRLLWAAICRVESSVNSNT